MRIGPASRFGTSSSPRSCSCRRGPAVVSRQPHDTRATVWRHPRPRNLAVARAGPAGGLPHLCREISRRCSNGARSWSSCGLSSFGCIPGVYSSGFDLKSVRAQAMSRETDPWRPAAVRIGPVRDRDTMQDFGEQSRSRRKRKDIHRNTRLSRWAEHVRNPNPLLAKRFGSLDNGWARQIPHARSRIFETGSRRVSGPVGGCKGSRSRFCSACLLPRRSSLSGPTVSLARRSLHQKASRIIPAIG
jgi:hypothetical protein